MGYTAYITRDTSHPFLASDPLNTVPSIFFDEWLLVVESDAELIRKGDNSAQWCHHDLPFEYHPEKKSICHHDPQPGVIAKMLVLAAQLNAVVRGGDGEIYTSSTEFHWPHSPDSKTPSPVLPNGKTVAYLPVIVGLLAMVTSAWLFDTLLATLTAGLAAPVITFLLLAIPSFWGRTA